MLAAMPPKDRPVQPLATGEDTAFEASLRPKAFGEFVGQSRVVGNLKVYLAASKKRAEPLDHVLLSGLPGLGKTTLAQIVSREMGGQFVATSAPALDRAKDLVGILTTLQKGDVLFVDEIHRLNPVVTEYLFGAMEDFAIDVVIDQGPNARTVKLSVPPFTLVGATTREGLLPAPFRSRFGILEKLEAYPWQELLEILRRTASVLGMEADPAGLETVARRARGTPRVANRFLRRIRDVAQAREAKRIDAASVEEGLSRLGVDAKGLDAMDRKILETLVRQGRTPVGLKTIAVTVGEEEETIEEVYEPFLIQQGFLAKTPRGRTATDAAYAHLGAKVPASPMPLFDGSGK